MKQPIFDKNGRIACPCCHKSEGVDLVWTGGDNYFGTHENDFECDLCKCEFTVVYKIEGIKIIEEGEKIND
jgi:hypothetical protein